MQLFAKPDFLEPGLLPAGTFRRRDPTQMGAGLRGIYACHLLAHTTRDVSFDTSSRLRIHVQPDKVMIRLE